MNCKFYLCSHQKKILNPHHHSIPHKKKDIPLFTFSQIFNKKKLKEKRGISISFVYVLEKKKSQFISL